MTDTETPKPKRRWYQYSLRTLFVVMTMVACFCSWYAYEMNEAAKRRAAIEEIKTIGGMVFYYDADIYPVMPAGGEPPDWYSLLRQLHGDEHLGNAISVFLDGTQITDADLIHLKGLTELEGLYLHGTQITDAGLVHLRDLPRLEVLKPNQVASTAP